MESKGNGFVSMEKLRLGDEIRLRLYPKVDGVYLSPGKVVYIHPDKRFFTLEFTTLLGVKIRQSCIPHGPMEVKEKNEK